MRLDRKNGVEESKEQRRRMQYRDVEFRGDGGDCETPILPGRESGWRQLQGDPDRRTPRVS